MTIYFLTSVVTFGCKVVGQDVTFDAYSGGSVIVLCRSNLRFDRPVSGMRRCDSGCLPEEVTYRIVKAGAAFSNL